MIETVDKLPTSGVAADLRRIPQLSLVMPAFNEEAGIAVVLDEYREVLGRLCARFEIVVVDDGSTDSTALRLAAARERVPELRVVTHGRNLGYAAAVARGLAAARFDPILYTDADGQFDLGDLEAAHALLGPEIDLVAGYRVDRADPWLRRFAAAGFNLLVRALLDIRARDVDCAFKLFRRRFFDSVSLASDGFLVDAEIYARARRAGLRIAQLPVRHRPRRAGRSTVRLAAVWTSWRQLLALRRRLRDEARRDERADVARLV